MDPQCAWVRLVQPAAAAAAAHLVVDVSEVLAQMQMPSRAVADAGDVALPCFVWAKARRAPPPAIAAELAGVISAALPGVTVVASKGFVNITFSCAQVCRVARNKK